MMTGTVSKEALKIRGIKLFLVNDNTGETKLIAYANNAYSKRMLEATEEQLSFNLKDGERLEREVVYR